MKKCELIAIGALPWVLACVAIATSPSSSFAQEPITVSVEDIGSKVTLVGRLGQPLGKMMEVKGTWRMPDDVVKDYSLRFIVSHVNGKPLKEPVEFNVAQIDAVSKYGNTAIPKYAWPIEEQSTLDGVAWTLRAYETGRIDSIPPQYWKERGTLEHARPYWTESFTSQLVGVVQPRSTER